MVRIPPLKPEEMTEEERRLAAKIAGPRGGVVGGPFAIWLRNPALVDKADDFGNLLREGTSVPRRLSELAILVTARHWSAQYEWFAHEKMALDHGIAKDVVEAIRSRRRPPFDKQDEQAVYELVTELYETKAVSDRTYGAAVEALGEQAVMELVTIATFYAMIAMFLVTFQVDLPEGATLPLPTG
jgi:4-carboxymuconolactone decarboxylase